MPPPEQCPKCEAKGSFVAVGPGVERLEQEAAELFPGARILVLSSDLVEGLRTTAAHSTLIISDTNSTAIMPDGSLGKGAEDVTVDGRGDRPEGMLQLHAQNSSRSPSILGGRRHDGTPRARRTRADAEGYRSTTSRRSSADDT